ncbi:hypothetical protein J6590_064260 [Homalodisca vitripennis]|nr:hypothetical protein J6590_064260 [Homalodisca vitripennis]
MFVQLAYKATALRVERGAADIPAGSACCKMERHLSTSLTILCAPTSPATSRPGCSYHESGPRQGGSGHLKSLAPGCRCRRCGTPYKTNAHVLGHCSRMVPAIKRRHDSILDILASESRGQGTEVRVDFTIFDRSNNIIRIVTSHDGGQGEEVGEVWTYHGADLCRGLKDIGGRLRFANWTTLNRLGVDRSGPVLYLRGTQT